ncbi:MAG: UTP--glucose-1-phosphate uridylyltransferase [bacterium]|nr:UTP--glucose-1-phosphate uridylyltransferase [bacterium]
MTSATKTDFKFYLNTWQSQESLDKRYQTCQSPKESLLIEYTSLIPASESLETLFQKCVIIKLNGGLATSMSQTGPKALVPLNARHNILDKCILNHLKLEDKVQKKIPFMFMLSPFTKSQTLKEMEKSYPEFTYDYVTQSEIPRYNTSQKCQTTLKAPPGHGELILLLQQSGKLKQLVENGIEYAFISNIDNLAANAEPTILNHCITHTPPLLMEVVKKSPQDKKGGIVAQLSDGSHTIIESAEQNQLPDALQAQIQTYPYFNTNNLWIHLPSLLTLLERNAFPLQVLGNKKRINNQDTIQFETVIGKLLESYEKPQFLLVDESRFCPIKSDDDLKKIQTSQAFHLVIQSNSPGELSHWVAPICNSIQSQFPNTDIELFLTPCQYSSGEEYQFAKTLPNITHVHSPDDTLKAMLTPPYRRQKQSGGAVLFLGGDPNYSKQLARKFGYPAFAYAERPLKGFEKCFTNKHDGDLMESAISPEPVDREKLCRKYNLDPNSAYCLFMPGSRRKHFEPLFPLMSEIISQIRNMHADFKPLILIAPFIEKELEESIVRTNNENAQFVLRADSKELISIAEMMVSIPGTNTIEAGYLGTPMVCILPTNKPEALIFDGILGLLSTLPVVGLLVKQVLIQLATKHFTYFSKPNIQLNKPVVPEYVGKLNTSALATKIATHFYDKAGLAQQKKALKELRQNRKVADTIVREILTF